MKLKSKAIKEQEIDAYIQKYNGKLTENEILLSYMEAPERKGYVEYYELDNGGLLFVVKQLVGRSATLYEDKVAYIKNKAKLNEWNSRTPLDKHQEKIMNLSKHIQPLLNELYAALKMDSDTPVKDVDLGKLDKAIKKYGYDRAYEDLFLHLIVFGGEYIKSQKGGRWITEKSEKDELVPVFNDGEKGLHNLDFWIEKDFKKKGKIDMKTIILSQLHGPLPVSTNPTFQDPNEQ